MTFLVVRISIFLQVVCMWIRAVLWPVSTNTPKFSSCYDVLGRQVRLTTSATTTLFLLVSESCLQTRLRYLLSLLKTL